MMADCSVSPTGIGEVEWAFKCSFSVSEQELASPNVDLVFDGLDTFASVVVVSP